MGKLKESAISELHWVIPGWNEGHDAYIRLKQLIKDDAAYFAEAHVSARNYTWNHPIADWQPLSTASPDMAIIVEDILASVSDRIHAAAPKYADSIMSFPNDDYIFFKPSDSGNIDVLITGWGYSNYKKASGRVFRKARRSKDPLLNVRIAFTSNGVPNPSRTFYLIDKGGNKKQLSTNADGWFNFPGQPVGASETFIDILSGLSFNATWLDGQSDYTFEVPPIFSHEEELVLEPPVISEPPQDPEPTLPPEVPTPLIEISVIDKNGKPAAGAKISMRQNDVIINKVLDNDGRCSIKNDSFITEAPITTNIVSPSRSFPEFVWSTEPDEYQYILQEDQSKQTPLFPQILAAFLLCLASILFVWGVVELGKYLNHLIYS